MLEKDKVYTYREAIKLNREDRRLLKKMNKCEMIPSDKREDFGDKVMKSLDKIKRIVG